MNDTLEPPDSDNENTPAPDFRIVAALDEKGVTYEINADRDSADCFMLVGFDDNRIHRVVINSSTREFMGVEMRTIASIALTSQGPFEARTANFLLRENVRLEFGAWNVIFDTEKMHYAVFSVTVSAALRAQSLCDLIGMVARIADDTENRLSGLDEF